MSTLDEVVFLEEKLRKSEDELAKKKTKITSLETKIDRLKEKIFFAKGTKEHYERELKGMRADNALVSISRHQTSKAMLKITVKSIADFNNQVSSAKNEITVLQREVKELESQVKNNKSKLTSYGKIIKFNKRKKNAR